MLLPWQSSSYCSASLGLSPCSLLKFLASNNFMSHTERHVLRALSTTRRNTFNHNLSKLLDFVLEQLKPSPAKSIFCNSKYGRSATQLTHKGDRPLTVHSKLLQFFQQSWTVFRDGIRPLEIKTVI